MPRWRADRDGLRAGPGLRRTEAAMAGRHLHCGQEMDRPAVGSGQACTVRALHGELLESAGYAIERYDCTVPIRWTLDELVGLTFSMSVSSKRQLGDRVDAFEADLRSELLAYDGSGAYEEQLPFFAIIAWPGE